MTGAVAVLLTYVVILFAGDRLVRWLERREADQAVARYEHGKRLASQAAFLDKLEGLRREHRTGRLDVTRVPGDSDAEIVGYLVDGRFEPRRTW